MRLESVCECEVVRDESKVVALPYEAVGPYCTCVVAVSFVVQDIVAPVVVILPADMDVSDGPVVSASVVNVDVTALFDVRDTVQVLPLDVVHPDHTRVEFVGTAVSVTVVPLLSAVLVQVDPHDIPPTDDVMVPLPVPCLDMERV